MASDSESNPNSSGGNNGGGPWWVKIIERFGVWAALVAFLVYTMATGMVSKVSSIDEKMTAAHVEMSKYAKDSTEASVQDRIDDRRYREESLRIWRQMCVSQAKTDIDRRACVR